MSDTYTWLKDSLEFVNEPVIKRNGREWVPVAGFRKVGCIFAIYKDSTNYCVHGADTWDDNEEPNLGYYDINLSWDELLEQVSERYDSIRSRVLNK